MFFVALFNSLISLFYSTFYIILFDSFPLCELSIICTLIIVECQPDHGSGGIAATAPTRLGKDGVQRWELRLVHARVPIVSSRQKVLQPREASLSEVSTLFIVLSSLLFRSSESDIVVWASQVMLISSDISNLMPVNYNECFKAYVNQWISIVDILLTKRLQFIHELDVGFF